MKRKETVREFINRRSYGAYITFEFEKYRCISVEDFLAEYGRISTYILDDYIVIDTKESYPSVDQGQTVWLTLQKKSEYVNTLKLIELNVFEVEDILNKLYEVKTAVSEDFESSSNINYIINLLEGK